MFYDCKKKIGEELKANEVIFEEWSAQRIGYSPLGGPFLNITHPPIAINNL